MALKINKTLSTESGLALPVDNVVTSQLHSPFVRVYKDGEGVTKYERRVTYDLRNYVSNDNVIKEGDNFIPGGVEEFPAGYEKILTDVEYADLLSDGALAEVWLKEYLDGILGANSATIYDPYV